MSVPVCTMCLHKQARHTLPGGKCDECTSPGADRGCKYEWAKAPRVSSVGVPNAKELVDTDAAGKAPIDLLQTFVRKVLGQRVISVGPPTSGPVHGNGKYIAIKYAPSDLPAGSPPAGPVFHLWVSDEVLALPSDIFAKRIAPLAVPLAGTLKSKDPLIIICSGPDDLLMLSDQFPP